jgi:hypothetical protein
MNKPFIIVLFLSSLFSPLQQCLAHDPGLSLLKTQLLKNQVKLEFTFAQADIESLIMLDANNDLNISQTELNVAQPELYALLTDGVVLRNGNQSLKVDQVTVFSAPSNTIKANLTYSTRMQRDIHLEIPLISRFARGHRQHLTVRDASGKQIVQQILSKQSGSINIKATATSQLSIFQQYLSEGVWHIWIGFDHILFLLTLLLPSVLVYRQQHWQSITQLLPAVTDTLKIVTAFTIAHSITLALAVLQIIQLPLQLVEIVIALSVLITAVNNLIPRFSGSRWLLAFGFCLIHGFGFDSVLTDLGLANQALITSLVGFNLGVELGQLAIVCLFLPLAFVIRHTEIYRQWVFRGGSVLAGLVACVWMVERVADVELFGVFYS